MPRTTYERLTIGLSLVTVCVMMLLSASKAWGQEQIDPLVGIWNMQGSAGGGLPSFIAVMTFNSGGTTVEFDTAGTNSSVVETIVLGQWQKTANSTYKAKEENYVYDSSGNLSLIDITAADINLNPAKNSFNGSAVTSFYTCSVSLCPGSLVVSTPFHFTGTRF